MANHKNSNKINPRKIQMLESRVKYKILDEFSGSSLICGGNGQTAFLVRTPLRTNVVGLGDKVGRWRFCFAEKMQ